MALTPMRSSRMFGQQLQHITIKNSSQASVTYEYKLAAQHRARTAAWSAPAAGAGNSGDQEHTVAAGRRRNKELATAATASSLADAQGQQQQQRYSGIVVDTVNMLSVACPAARAGELQLRPGQSATLVLECPSLALGDFALASALELRPRGAAKTAEGAARQVLRLPVLISARVPFCVVRVSQPLPLAPLMGPTHVTRGVPLPLQWTDIPPAAAHVADAALAAMRPLAGQVQSRQRGRRQRQPARPEAQHVVRLPLAVARPGEVRGAVMLALDPGAVGTAHEFRLAALTSAETQVLFNGMAVLEGRVGGRSNGDGSNASKSRFFSKSAKSDKGEDKKDDESEKDSKVTLVRVDIILKPAQVTPSCNNRRVTALTFSSYDSSAASAAANEVAWDQKSVSVHCVLHMGLTTRVVEIIVPLCDGATLMPVPVNTAILPLLTRYVLFRTQYGIL